MLSPFPGHRTVVPVQTSDTKEQNARKIKIDLSEKRI
jgi:hypothetical protein